MCFVRPVLLTVLLCLSACSSEAPSSETSQSLDTGTVGEDGVASGDGVTNSDGKGRDVAAGPDVAATTDTGSSGGDTSGSQDTLATDADAAAAHDTPKDSGPPAECAIDADCDDSVICTVDTCQSDGYCANVLSASSCLIDGACVEDGVTSSSAACLSCQPGRSQTEWSEIDAACDDELACTADVCNPSAGCEHTVESGCLIDQTCIGTDTLKDGSDCLACQPTVATTTWSEVATACDDALLCTEDMCDATTGCTHQLLAGNCLIDGTCVASEGTNPEANCLSCQPAVSAEAWSEIANFCDDGLICTQDACDPSSGCTHMIQEGFCVIDGVCVETDAENPDNECLTCQPDVSTSAWTPRQGSCDDGEDCSYDDTCDTTGTCAGIAYSCDDGLDCTPDICFGNGFCADAVNDGWCLIGGACWEVGTINPDNECQRCTDKVGYSYSWVPVENETPCTADDLPCTNDICLSGKCSHPVYSFVQGCSIDGVCYGSNATNPNQPCQRCDAEQWKYGWTDKADGERCAQCGRCDGLQCNPAADLDYEVCDDQDAETFGDWCSSGSCSGFSTVTNDTGKPNTGYTHAAAAGPGAVHALYRDCSSTFCVHRAEYFTGGATADNDQSLGLAVPKPGLSASSYTSFNTMWSFDTASGWSDATGLAAAFNGVAPQASWHTVANSADDSGFVSQVHAFGWQASGSTPVAMLCQRSLLCPSCSWVCDPVDTADTDYDASMRECAGVQTRVVSTMNGSTVNDTLVFCNNAESSSSPNEYRFWVWQSAGPRWWTGPTQFQPLDPGQHLRDLLATPDRDAFIMAGSQGLLVTYGATNNVFDPVEPAALDAETAAADFLQIARRGDATFILTSITNDLSNGQEETQVGILMTPSTAGDGFIDADAWRFNPVLSYTCPTSGACLYEVTSMAATDDAVYIFGAWSSDGVTRDRAMWYWAAPN